MTRLVPAPAMRPHLFPDHIRRFLLTALTLSASLAWLTACPVLAFDLSSVDTVTIGDQPYVSIVRLAEAFNLGIGYDSIGQSMTVTRGDDTISLRNRSGIVRHPGGAVNVVAPARLVNGSLYAPARTFLPVFSSLVPGAVSWDDGNGRLTATGMNGSVRSIGIEDLSNGTLIRVGLAEAVAHSCEERTIDGRRWLILRLEGGILDTDSLAVSQPAGLVRAVKAISTGGDLALCFLVSDAMERFDVTANGEPAEGLMISLRRKRDPATADATTPQPATPPVTEPLISTDIWRIDTIVIDPGHGGKDPGAVGPSGTKEKDIVLEVAQELRKIAEQRGEVKAVMTRDSDVFIPLYQRGRIANREGGKLFISIHANAARSRNASGMEVFFLSVAKTEDAKRVAERENAVIELEDDPGYYETYFDNAAMSKEVREIMKDMVSKTYLTESQHMAYMLLTSSLSATRQHNRGVKQAPFLVLKNTQASMPSVLFEIGFISNPAEEKLLRRASHRKRLAEAMYNAIIEFKHQAEKNLFTVSRSQ